MIHLVRRGLLTLFVPTLLIVLTACPGVVIDNIQVSFSGGIATVGATGTFTCISPVTDEVVTYLWSFGDGSTAEGKTVTHVYLNPGDFLVECRVITSNTVLTFLKKLEITSALSLGSKKIVHICEDVIEELCVFDGETDQITILTLPGDTIFVKTFSVNSDGLIAFTCFDPPRLNICTINIDGSGFTNLSGIPTADNDEPSINDSGVIAFLCFDTTPNICVINKDGSGFNQVTTNLDADEFQGVPYINNAGEIVYECEDDNGTDSVSNICFINSDGTGFLQLTSDTISSKALNVNPRFADDGTVVFDCWNAIGTNICAINKDGTGRLLLTADSDGQAGIAGNFLGNSNVNANGVIGYLCSDSNLDGNICAINSDGLAFKQLTFASDGLGGDGNSDPWIADDGLVAFICFKNNVSNLCITDIDSTTIVTLTDSQFDVRLPVIVE